MTALAEGPGHALAGAVKVAAPGFPERTLKFNAPFATTLFDDILPATLLGAAHNQVHEMSVFVLNLSGIVCAKAALGAHRLAETTMQSRNGVVFSPDQPGKFRAVTLADTPDPVFRPSHGW